MFTGHEYEHTDCTSIPIQCIGMIFTNFLPLSYFVDKIGTMSIHLRTMCLFAILVLGNLPLKSQEKKVPSFEAVLSLPSVRNVQMAPDGSNITFEVTHTDWEANRYDTEIWLSRNGGSPFRLTNNPEGSSSNAKWSPDGQWIAYLANKKEHTQIYVLRLAGGESFAVTDGKGDVQDFEWRPDGKAILFLQNQDDEKARKSRKEKYGDFAEEDHEYLLTRLWIISFDPSGWEHPSWPGKAQESLNDELHGRIVLDSVPYTITGFLWSPDGRTVAIQHQPDPLINTFLHSDISLLDAGDGTVSPLIRNLSSDGLLDWSPDGNSILYQSNLTDSTSNYYRNGHLFMINCQSRQQTPVAAGFDEEFSGLQWTASGIFGLAYQKTRRMLWQIDPGNPERVLPFINNPDRISGFASTKDGRSMAFIGSSASQLDEVYLMQTGQPTIQLTHFTSEIKNWKLAQSEVIQWESKDGQVIEGVLMKPENYDPSKKHPLLVIIHGGPTGISVPAPIASYVYPVAQWLAKGALILMPNYRGSAGYGEAFRALNVRNLGVGDAWDVLSGVDELIGRGLVDADSMGCMGWSQGGYISAFLTTNTGRFKAISVGAGISDWMTYYVNTDIHPFTRQYLKATPWSDPEIYAKTSPISTIQQASTPTLIQHGEFDRRVPIANGYELYQGLQDVGVPVKMMVYKGFGHGITKPKERLAATWHNWQWFGKYIWGEELTMPEK